jgi:hypothetical protein
MLKKFKHFLGIEGARVNLYLDKESDLFSGIIVGKVELTSLRPVKILSLHYKLEERYRRGRGKRKLIDKYHLAGLEQQLNLELKANDPQIITFNLTFDKIKSPIDEIGEKNPVTKALAWTIKKIKSAESQYILTAEAVVEGTKLNPFDTLEILVD